MSEQLQNEDVKLTEARSLAFMLAGNATVTLRSVRTGTRYTFKIQKAKPSKDPLKPKQPDTWFVNLLTGPNNEADYRYMGMIRNGVFNVAFTYKDRNSGLRKPTGFTVTTPSVVAFMWTLRKLNEAATNFGVEIFHSGTCGRCGRKLTVPESIETGLGPECAEKGFGGF
jgi:hypothetical protein